MEHNKTEHNKTESWKMFDRIASRYDLLNRILSMRQDVLWRKKLSQSLPNKQDLDLLDVATGTGDQILHLLSVTKKIKSAIGIDLSQGMLDQGREKIVNLRLENKVSLQTGDACQIPFKDESFDVATMSFGIRNVPDVPQALREIHRVLKKDGGTALILEFSLPQYSFVKKPYLFYFRKVLPKIGSMISGDSVAYRYLNETVEEFPYGEDFANLLKQAGFSKVTYTPMTFGICTLYKAIK